MTEKSDSDQQEKEVIPGSNQEPAIGIPKEEVKLPRLSEEERKVLVSEDKKAKAELEKAGAPSVFLEHTERYFEDDVPVMYRTDESHEVIWGGKGVENYGKKAESSLLVGMKSPIWENHSKYADQNPNVIVQWRGIRFPHKEGSKPKITREEAEEVKPGVYIIRTYDGVSALGSFDGSLSRIKLQMESGEFHPDSCYPGRKEYRLHEFFRGQDGSWTPLGLNVTGTTILNGASELFDFNLPKIHSVKDELPPKTKQLPAGEEDRSEAIALEIRLKELIERHPEIVEKVRAFTEDIYELSMGSLEDKATLGAAIEMMTDGILRYPERVFISGRVLSMFSGQSRFLFAQALARDGRERFVEWYNETGLKGLFTGDSLRNRVIDKNTYHFVQFWDIHTNGKFYEPDWVDMERSFARLKSGQNYANYPLLNNLFDGLQTSAIECFAEDVVIERVMGEDAKKMPEALPPLSKRE